jgi:Ala-tRNA(Pro) deacylase
VGDKQKVLDTLDGLGIKYTVHEHEPLMTCEGSDAWLAREGAAAGIDDTVGRSKNLLLRNKAGDKHYLVILESRKQLDMAGLAKLLDEKKISFASEERLKKFLGLTPGAVSPFGLVNDVRSEVRVIVDTALLNYDRLMYHPNVNTATVELSTDDFMKFLNSTGNRILQTDL